MLLTLSSGSILTTKINSPKSRCSIAIIYANLDSFSYSLILFCFLGPQGPIGMLFTFPLGFSWSGASHLKYFFIFMQKMYYLLPELIKQNLYANRFCGSWQYIFYFLRTFCWCLYLVFLINIPENMILILHL